MLMGRLLPQPGGFEGLLPLEESTDAHDPPVLNVKYVELPFLDSDSIWVTRATASATERWRRGNRMWPLQ